ncbi:MAG: class I SAM-dependent methyltransferase [Boseongicola sp.]|nr:class I SAM-dependent methyltransferase [Boseongicola sp.]NNJ68403.1 class I SAM-dependent methyltransferase [Boseongicola sp.]
MSNVEFWNRAARNYAKRPISNMPAYEQTLDHVRRHLKSDHETLEVGCGTGSTAFLLAPSVGHYSGTDISLEMIKIAQEKLASDPNDFLDFFVSRATLDDVQTASKDVVLGFNLYHLVPDLDAALAAAHRVLKPGGLFIAKTPCIGKMWYLRPLIKALQLVGKAPPVTFFTSEAYDAAIRSAGFDILETAYYAPNTNNRFVVAKRT